MELVDTHCHIHFDDYPLKPAEAIANAQQVGVNRLICVGTTLADSRRAIDFAAGRDNVRASAGVHPHDATEFARNEDMQTEFKQILGGSSILAIGEIGLDYYKNYSPAAEQQKAFRLQIEAGLGLGLPFIFHVRDAWEDFWKVVDSYKGLSGVVHSFSADAQQLEQVLSRGLYVGLNGIMTFSNDAQQLEAAKAVPEDRLLLETDAPFLTPKPHRGHPCEPKHIYDIATFLADLRGTSLDRLAETSTKNAVRLFGMK